MLILKQNPNKCICLNFSRVWLVLHIFVSKWKVCNNPLHLQDCQQVNLTWPTNNIFHYQVNLSQLFFDVSWYLSNTEKLTTSWYKYLRYESQRITNSWWPRGWTLGIPLHLLTNPRQPILWFIVSTSLLPL